MPDTRPSGLPAFADALKFRHYYGEDPSSGVLYFYYPDVPDGETPSALREAGSFSYALQVGSVLAPALAYYDVLGTKLFQLNLTQATAQLLQGVDPHTLTLWAILPALRATNRLPVAQTITRLSFGVPGRVMPSPGGGGNAT